MTETAAALRGCLATASALLIKGDVEQAERRAKAVSALVRAERDVAEFADALAPSSEADDERLCDELLRRLVRYAEADRAGAPVEVLKRIATEGLVL